MNEIEPTASFFDFNPLAGEYDKWYKTAEGRQYDMLEKRALGRLIGKVESGVSLLEVGMGTGWWSLFFSELGYRVTGVDVSPNMVEVARLKNIPNARFLTVQDIHTLPDPYGKPTIKLCAFPVSIKTPPSIAGMADDFQAWLKMTSGAFIAVRVDL